MPKAQSEKKWYERLSAPTNNATKKQKSDFPLQVWFGQRPTD